MHMKEFNFPIIIEKDKDGYSAFCPSIQGCYAQGDTYEEVVANIEDALKLHVEDRISLNEEIPEVEKVSLSTVRIELQ